MITNTINKALSEKNLLIISVLAITVIVLFPFLYFGQDIKIPAFDNLDSNIVWIKMVIQAGGPYLPPNAFIDQPMNGLPLASVYGVYDFSMIWFYFFGSFWGYAVNKYLIALIAFFGMYFLLKKHFLPKDCPAFIAIGTALLFGILPFWSFGTHVAGIPMAFCAFLNIRNGDKNLVNWFALLLQAFYSSLVLSGIFLLGIVSIILFIDTIRTKKINLYFLAAIACMSIAYIISHLPMFMTYLSPDFVSHRIEMRTIVGATTIGFPIESGSIIPFLMHGNIMHAPGYQKWILIPILLALITMLAKRKIDRRFIYISLFILFVIVWVFFCIPFIQKEIFKDVNLFDISRFTWLLPCCWYLLLAMSLYQFVAFFRKWHIYLIAPILGIQFVLLFLNQPFIVYRHLPSYHRMYGEELFTDIKSYINKDLKSYRIVSIGLPPAISQMNGFYTIDGFTNAYSIEYKHKFRKIIAKEIDKSDEIKDIFDYFGAKCYLFSAEVGAEAILNNNDPEPIKNLDLDYDQLKSMGGEYILCTTTINTDKNPRIQLLKAFDNYTKVFHWKIYLYKVN